MLGFKNKDKKFIPTGEKKGMASSSVNSQTEIENNTTTSKLGDKNLKKETIKITIQEPNKETLNLAEKQVESEIKENVFGNVYQFKNGERWYIVSNMMDANKLAKKELEDIYKQMGILAWEQSYIESFIDEEMLKRKMGVTFNEIYQGKNGTPDFKTAKRIPIDVDQMIDKSIKNDGASHSLAKFDGKEFKLKNGSLMYRMN